MIENLIVFVEEPSAEAALEELLPKIIGEASFDIRVFQCKDELLKRLPERLAGYSRWLPDTSMILVLVDRDDDDCHSLKSRLESVAASAGLISKTAAPAGERFHVVNRILIEELEAWFFGDWSAVAAAYPRVSTTVPQKTPYRNSDAIQGGTWEALERVLQDAGYFSSGLRKIECARSVAKHMKPAENRSQSFQVFREAILSETK